MAYGEARKHLQITIWRAKDRNWGELCGLVDSDPWGKPYMIVMARVKGNRSRKVMTPEQARGIMSHLFITGPEEQRARAPVTLLQWSTTRDDRALTMVTPGWMREVLTRIKPKKAPVLDMVPSEGPAC